MKDRPNITFEYLNKKISNYITDSDELSLIKEAYQYADQIHKGQKRLEELNKRREDDMNTLISLIMGKC